jgi:hypothetical protein
MKNQERKLAIEIKYAKEQGRKRALKLLQKKLSELQSLFLFEYEELVK